jgi:hypothetical protein
MVDLDELIWKCGGDGSLVSDADWLLIHDHLLTKLSRFLKTEVKLREAPSIGRGFFSQFETSTDSSHPFQLRLWGTFGVDFPGGEFPCVQGFVYAYHDSLRLVTKKGHNHLYLRYARIDAADDDWAMTGCSGPSDWRSYGWSVDEYDEFEGFETWPDA